MNCALAITKQDIPFFSKVELMHKFLIQSNSLHVSVTAMESNSVVDKKTHFCNLDCHGTAPP